MSELKAVILGAGFMGQMHARNLSGVEGVKVCAICDAMESAAKSAAEPFGAEAYTNFEKMIDSVKPDALYVCLPPFAHNGQVEMAAERGIHVFLEKPVALTLERALSMENAINKAGVVSQVGFHYRFKKGVSRIKNLIDSGKAGNPSQFNGRYWCNMDGGAWWRDASRSGGQIFEQLCHIYDLARYLLGEGEAVNGFLANTCRTKTSDYSIEDTSLGMIRHTNGAVSSISGSNCAIPDHFIGDFRLVCENVVFDYRSTGDWRVKDESLFFFNGSGKLSEEKYEEDENVYLNETLDFIAAIRDDGKTRTPISEGIAGIKLVTAVIESARGNGIPVKL